MKKKFLILSIMMLLVTMFLSANVLAATITSATVTITPSKTEYKSGETIEFTISLKDLTASSGILGLGAYIEYDSNLLTLEPTAKGLSGWVDADISEKTHRFITTKNSHSANNEDILKISFTAKEVTSDITTSVKLKKIEISNGVEYDIDEISSNNITLKKETPTTPEKPPVDEGDKGGNEGNQGEEEKHQNPTTPTNPNTPNNPTNPTEPTDQNTPDTPNDNTDNQSTPSIPGTSNNSNNNSSNNDSNNSSSSIPQLGTNGVLAIIIAIIVIIAVIIFIKIKIIDKKIKRGN